MLLRSAVQKYPDLISRCRTTLVEWQAECRAGTHGCRFCLGVWAAVGHRTGSRYGQRSDQQADHAPDCGRQEDQHCALGSLRPLPLPPPKAPRKHPGRQRANCPVAAMTSSEAFASEYVQSSRKN